MIRKLWSDKFLVKFRSIQENHIRTLLGFTRTKIVYHPLIWGKGFKDVKTVFKQTKEDDEKLIKYYSPWWNKGKTRSESVAYLQEGVNKRINYLDDKTNWGKIEYWASPIEIHERKIDDCDGYAVLLCHLLRLFGFTEYEVFVGKGPVRRISGARGEIHAYCIVLDWDTMFFWAIEGSWYPSLSVKDWKQKTNHLTVNDRYIELEWMTNDKISMDDKFIHWRFTR